MTDSAPLRFVLLRHDVPESFGRASHWDLMIERPDLLEEHRLATWAIESLPLEWIKVLALNQTEGSDSVKAKQLPDHRAHYLDYEGPVSDDRGEVFRCLSGQAVWQEHAETRIMVQLVMEWPLSLAGTLNLGLENPGERLIWSLKWVGKPQ